MSELLLDFELEVGKARVLYGTVRRPTSERQRRASRSQTLQKCHRLTFAFGDLNFSLANFAFAYRNNSRILLARRMRSCAEATRLTQQQQCQQCMAHQNKPSTRKSEMHRHGSHVEEPSCRCCTLKKRSLRNTKADGLFE